MAHRVLKITVKGIDKASSVLQTLGGSVTVLGGLALGVATGGVLALAWGISSIADAAVNAGFKVLEFAEDSVKMAMEFEDAMKILEFAIIDLETPLETVHDAVIKVGEDTSLFGVDAEEAAEGVTILALAGLSTNEIFGDLEGYMEGVAEAGGVLRSSIDLAAASELELNAAAEFGVVILSTFGGELETDAGRLDLVSTGLDHTVRAADASIASVADLTQSYKTVGPVMSGFGFTVEETNTLLAMLSDRGVKGAEAGTALKSMFTNILRPTEKVQEALEDYNIELFDNQGNMLTAIEILGNLETATEDLTDKDRLRLVQTLAGSYGQKAAFALLDEGVEGYGEMTQSIADATSMQEKAEARTSTLSGQMEVFDGVMDTLKITVGEEFLPVGTELVQILIGLVETHGPDIIRIFEGVAAGFEVAAYIYGTTLEPALEGLVKVIGLSEEEGDSLLVTFGFLIGSTIGSFILGLTSLVEKLTIAIAFGRSAWGVFESALWGVQNALKWVRDWVEAVKTSLDGLDLPDWLTPGSPTPFELGLRGVGNAIRDLPEMSFSANVTRPAMAGGGGMTSYVAYNHFGVDSVRSDQDILDIADKIREAWEIRGVQPAL